MLTTAIQKNLSYGSASDAPARLLGYVLRHGPHRRNLIQSGRVVYPRFPSAQPYFDPAGCLPDASVGFILQLTPASSTPARMRPPFPIACMLENPSRIQLTWERPGSNNQFAANSIMLQLPCTNTPASAPACRIETPVSSPAHMLLSGSHAPPRIQPFVYTSLMSLNAHQILHNAETPFIGKWIGRIRGQTCPVICIALEIYDFGPLVSFTHRPLYRISTSPLMSLSSRFAR
jgi:hypothetical protein